MPPLSKKKKELKFNLRILWFLIPKFVFGPKLLEILEQLFKRL